MPRGRRPLGERAMTGAERRQARYAAKVEAEHREAIRSGAAAGA